MEGETIDFNTEDTLGLEGETMDLNNEDSTSLNLTDKFKDVDKIEKNKFENSEIDDVSMAFDMPKNQSSVIKVIGVGGGGSNAVNYMIDQGIRGVDFVICNTDAQALDQSSATTKIQLGISLTEGLGAGEDPIVGEKSALESEVEIKDILMKNTKMVFITAGMGGGTGTGAAPVIAKICKELDILTIGIVTVPFNFEGPKRFKQAQEGIANIREYVDSLIVINNDNLVDVYGDLGVTSGFAKADEILMVAARSISEVITQNCTLNIDLNDAKTVLKNSGTAIMGSGQSNGENRAQDVVEKALDSPLLNDNHIRGAKKILLLILSGKNEITIKEINEINSLVQRESGGNTDIILGVGQDLTLDQDISITIIATGVLGQSIDPSTGSEPRKVHVLETNSNQDVSQQSVKNLEQDNVLNIENDTVNNLSQDIEIDGEKNTNGGIQVTSTKIKSSTKADNNLSSNNDSNTVEFIHDDLPNKNPILNDKKTCKILNDHIIDDNRTDISDANIKRAEERKKRLQKFHNLNFNNKVVLQELEDEPAYKRQGLELDDVEHSSLESVSRVTLNSNSNEIEIKNNNSFLHDNVD